MSSSANLGFRGGPEPPRTLLSSWEKLVPVFIFGGLAVAGLIILVGPTGKTKEAVSKIKPHDKSALDNKSLPVKARQKILAAKPAGKRWTDMSEEDLAGIVSRVSVEGMSKEAVRSLVNEMWREGRTDEQVLPSDNAAERWKQLTGQKFENLRRIDLKDETGTLNCPQVDVFEDEGKAKPAGSMNHDEWVVIVENKGAMAKVQRRKDKKEGWIETKWLKEIYTKEDIAKGPDPYKPKEKEEGDRKPSGKDDGWDD